MQDKNITNRKNYKRHGYNERYYKTTGTFFYLGYYLNTINYGYYKFSSIDGSYSNKRYHAR